MPDNEPTTFGPVLTGPAPVTPKEPYNPYARNPIENPQPSVAANHNQPFSNSAPQSPASNYYPVIYPELEKPLFNPQPIKFEQPKSHYNYNSVPDQHFANYISSAPPVHEYQDLRNESKPPERTFKAPEPPPQPVQLPPQAPRGPPAPKGPPPPAPPPPPPPGYLTEDLPEAVASKLKIQRGKIGLAHAQLEHEKEEKRLKEKEERERKERERREREERERREREERERREKEERERIVREERERIEREIREREERVRLEREEREKIERENREREEEQLRQEREEYLRREREREEMERRAQDVEALSLIERQLRENEELERRERELILEIERIKREQDRLAQEEQFQSELSYSANGHDENDHEDEFPWTQALKEMEIMERYEESPREAAETEVSSFKMDISALRPTLPPVQVARASAFEKLPPAPPPSGPSKARRMLQSPTPAVEHSKKVTICISQ